MMNPVLEALINHRVEAIVDPPRSWNSEAKTSFLQLPPALQIYYARREEQRDQEVRRAHSARDVARKKLAEAEAKLEAAEARIGQLEAQNEKLGRDIVKALEIKNAEAKDTDGTDQANSGRV